MGNRVKACTSNIVKNCTPIELAKVTVGMLSPFVNDP